MACQAFQGQRGPSCMALTNRPLILCSITTESVARATSRPGSLGPGAHVQFQCSPPWVSWAVQDKAGGSPVWAFGAGSACGESSEDVESLSLPGPWSSDFSSRDPTCSPHHTDQAAAWVPLELCQPLFSSITTGVLLSPSALPSAPGPAQAPSRTQSRSHSNLLSRCQASHSQSGLSGSSLYLQNSSLASPSQPQMNLTLPTVKAKFMQSNQYTYAFICKLYTYATIQTY